MIVFGNYLGGYQMQSTRFILKAVLTATAALLVLSACESSTPKLVGVPPEDIRKSEGSGVQTFNPAVDILFVIDDSGSMMSHQDNLRNNLNLFTAGLVSNKFVDYHIGVITTSENYQSYSQKGGGALVGRSIKYVDRTTVDGIRVLQDAIMVGTDGSPTEMVFDPLKKALTEPNLSQSNIGFYRSNAFLAVIFITDAEDQSVELDAFKTHQFLLELKKGDSSKLLTYGVIIPATDATGCARDGGNSPERIEDFFRLTGGSYYGLCDSDYGTRLSQIGSDLVQRIGRAVNLDRIPQLDTVRVMYGDQEILPSATDGWSYSANENSIVLGQSIKWTEQPEGTTIQVYFKPIQKN